MSDSSAVNRSAGNGRRPRRWRHRMVVITYRALRWAQRYLPPGIRSLIGIVLMAAGVVGFLPILGFWMFPLGLALAVTDVPPLRRRMERWLNSRRREFNGGPEGRRSWD